jgi:hypothetical protein
MEPNCALAVDLGLTRHQGPGRRGGASPSAPRSIVVSGPARDLEVKVAATRDEFEQAFRLLARQYQARGYEGPSPKLFRFTPYHALPDTATFVAKHDAAVVATLSLVPDTAVMGLPLEEIYGPEVARLRGEGRRLAEVTSLADQGLGHREFLQVFAALARLMCQHHLSQGGNTWVITTHPRHAAYYRKVLGFVPLGPRRSYPAVQGHPAEALLVDVDLMRANAPASHRQIFGEPLPRTILAAPGRPGDHAHHFAAQTTQADRRTILEVLHQTERLGGRSRWLEPGRIAA